MSTSQTILCKFPNCTTEMRRPNFYPYFYGTEDAKIYLVMLNQIPRLRLPLRDPDLDAVKSKLLEVARHKDTEGSGDGVLCEVHGQALARLFSYFSRDNDGLIITLAAFKEGLRNRGAKQAEAAATSDPNVAALMAFVKTVRGAPAAPAASLVPQAALPPAIPSPQPPPPPQVSQ